MQINGSTFLVTGGSSGLGAACAARLTEAGGNVVIADVDGQGEQLADRLGTRVRFVAADATVEEDVRRAIARARDVFGNFRGVINCAGILHGQRVLGTEGVHDLAAFRRVVEVNLVATFNVVRLAAKLLEEAEPLEDQERGVIVNTASIAAYDGQIGQAAYAASKAGVAAMTLPLAREFARFGVRVVCVAPGVFETPMMARVSDAKRHALETAIPFPPRFGRPDEFAALVRHVIENRLLNGEVIRLDGALRMPAR